jgi:hypothetical protein
MHKVNSPLYRGDSIKSKQILKIKKKNETKNRITLGHTSRKPGIGQPDPKKLYPDIGGKDSQL